ncbi:unnamed protein product [Rotaria socialis]|uniref:Uncharacterized protein n=1 Tax=Rotaria socialis TaxID=392032 RepID=A0A821I720_9BILA|nr:unnamed protein product [Rotaria socialis]CAF4483143.1 unnamed protein product [Rotaria socialis]CAF4519961.1 unnamed protein product [Rotaria socialis]CAF4697040.1 unnamed protein product [Rotaria socialis]CAF4854628.1 unnamed protein product [Rotaria socialis]
MSEPQQEKQNQGQDSIIEPSSSNQAEKNKQSLPSNVKKKKNHNNNYHSWSNKSKQNNRTSSWKKSSSFGQNKYGLPSFGSSTWQSTTGPQPLMPPPNQFLTYDLRPNRLKTRDGFFRKIHLGTYLDDIHDNPKSRGPPKTRWLRGIAAHLQQAINIGIENKWVTCPEIVRLLNLETTFIKGDFVKKANRLEFKQVQKKQHYFDGNNKPRETAVAYYLSFRLLKQTPQPHTIN